MQFMHSRHVAVALALSLTVAAAHASQPAGTEDGPSRVSPANTGSVTSPRVAPQTGGAQQAGAPAQQKRIDINKATRTELKTLPGITNMLAGKIIVGRPYGSTAHLVTRKIISLDLFRRIEGQVVAGLDEKILKKLIVTTDSK